MATLLRNSIYDEVPGMTQPDPITGSTSLSNPTSFDGSNTIYRNEASIDFFPDRPTTDYAGFKQRYDFDTGAFGMLANFYGPNLYRANTSEGFFQAYGNGQTSFGTGGTRAQLNIGIDPYLGYKQSEFGSIAFGRKILNDQIRVSPQQTLDSANLIASLPGFQNWAKKTADTRLNLERSIRGQGPISGASWVSKFDPTYGKTQFREGAVTTASIHAANYGDAQGFQVTGASSSMGNVPNVNLFGGFGVNTYRSGERLLGSAIIGKTFSIRSIANPRTKYVSPSSYTNLNSSYWR